MLKIKDSLSEKTVKKKLLKLGFVESWDYIGMIKMDNSFKFLNPSISIKDKNIKIDIYGEFDETRDKRQTDFIADTLYDLINSGLVEKDKIK